MDEGSEHSTGPRSCKTGKEMGSVLQFVSHVYKHIRGFASKEHETSVWKIILPDC